MIFVAARDIELKTEEFKIGLDAEGRHVRLNAMKIGAFRGALGAVVISVVISASGVACGDKGLQESKSDGPMPAFSLTDVNPASASYDTAVAPADFAGGISAWYFGHST